MSEKTTDGKSVPSNVLLATARVRLDPSGPRGYVSRGAYIVSDDGGMYLTHDGTWTFGITGDHNWWDNTMDAHAALFKLKANAQAEGRLTRKENRE